MYGCTCSGVASILDIQIVDFDEQYVGLPVPERHMKDEKIQLVKEKLKMHFSY